MRVGDESQRSKKNSNCALNEISSSSSSSSSILRNGRFIVVIQYIPIWVYYVQSSLYCSNALLFHYERTVLSLF